ncbi:hypothetical protein GSI_12839 [Ganoderma sinense ZZ0214-1]|uniref:Uncharacterized protein n=1 Tax=Ganoderma sinense ZZ0214-1 TaxID=1077348 RepID=A0A2G8RTW2_9APHY|nr:hypothetical protein GSI_12839 [Ganoderma sinense ZZ0214-1]
MGAPPDTMAADGGLVSGQHFHTEHAFKIFEKQTVIPNAMVRDERRKEESIILSRTHVDQRGAPVDTHTIAPDEQPSTERTKLGCRITYGPGACVQDIVTAFESHIVLLHNIPLSLTHTRLIDLAEPFGALKSAVIIPLRDGLSQPMGRVEYLNAQHAARAVSEISKSAELRGTTTRLDLRAAENGKAVLRSTKAKLSWFAPSLAGWAHYSSLSKAREKAAQLDGRSFRGATVRATFQTPSWNQRTSFSVEFKGLPLDISATGLKIFSGSDSVALGSPSFMIDDSVRELRKVLSGQGPLEAFDFVQPDGKKPKLVAFVQFANPDTAERAVAALHNRRHAFLRGSPTFLELIHSVKYMLPLAQFQAVRRQLDALKEILETCKLRYHDKDEYGRDVEKVCIRAYGPDAKGLGRLKTEIELLLKGDLVLDEDGQVVWHEYYSSASGRQLLDSAAAQTGTYIKCDARTRTVHLFGGQTGRVSAKARLLAVLAKLKAQEHILDLEQEAFLRMLHGGFQELQTQFGDKVLFDVVRKRIVMRGEEEDIRAIRDGIARQQTGVQTPSPTHHPSSLSDDTPCPVCFCDTTDPLTLLCGHCYCRACLHHYLGSLGQSQGGGSQVVATCLAETAQPDGSTHACGCGIPLDTIRVLLAPGQEERLLDAAFLSHIYSRPQEYHYCPTADCQTIYRASADDTVLRCPSCLARICASCHVEFHEGLTCAAFKDNTSGGNEAFQRWREEHGIKACPGCGADLEKSGGCNHMTCARCGTHMCWMCMKTFTDIDSGGGVYAHMRREHGGIGI